MNSQGHYESDFDSISSQTSNATSRVTTPSGLWNVKDVRNPQRNPASLTQSNTGKSANTAIRATPPGSNVNPTSSAKAPTSGSPSQAQPWINPYWGANPKSNAPLLQTPSNRSIQHDYNGRDSAAANPPQLIPGSILINERGEINDRSRQKNTTASSIVSSNPVNPNSDKQPNSNRGSASYLAPKSTQPGPPPLDRQPTPPGSQNNDSKPWVNPYWPSSNQASPPRESQKNSIRPSPSAATNSKPGTWVNPYWGTKPAGPSTSPANGSQQKANTQGTSASPAVQQDVKPVLLNRAYEFEQSASFDFDFLPTPSFYERIYPVQVPSPSSQSNANNRSQTNPAQGSTRKDVNDYNTSNALPGQGNMQSAGVENRGNPSYPPPAPTQKATVLPGLHPASSTPPPSYSGRPAGLSSSGGSILKVITKLDLDTIQEAFDTMATNPNSLPVIPSTAQLFRSQSNQGSNVPPSQSPMPAQKPEQRPSFPFTTTNPPSPPSNSRSPPLGNFSLGNYPTNTQYSPRPAFSSASYPSNPQPAPIPGVSAGNYPVRTQYPQMPAFSSANHTSQPQSPPMPAFPTGNIHPPNAQYSPLSTFTSGNYPAKTDYPQMQTFSTGGYPLTLQCIPVPTFSSGIHFSNGQSAPLPNFPMGNYEVISDPAPNHLPRQQSIVLI